MPGPPAASFLTGHLRWLISNENPAVSPEKFYIVNFEIVKNKMEKLEKKCFKSEKISIFLQNQIFKLRAWTREYGPVYGVMQGQLRVLVVSDPAMLHEVFVSKFEHFHGRKLAPIVGDVDREPRVHMFNARGPRWKRLRVLSNPVFSVANLKKAKYISKNEIE